jgi:hypothetical protein
MDCGDVAAVQQAHDLATRMVRHGLSHRLAPQQGSIASAPCLAPCSTLHSRLRISTTLVLLMRAPRASQADVPMGRTIVSGFANAKIRSPLSAESQSSSLSPRYNVLSWRTEDGSHGIACLRGRVPSEPTCRDARRVRRSSARSLSEHVTSTRKATSTPQTRPSTLRSL